MPDGMDGIETCRQLKSREDMRTTPVIFLTGKDDRETMMQAFEAGSSAYVLKNEAMGDLVESGQRGPQPPSAHRTVRTGPYTAPHARRIH